MKRISVLLIGLALTLTLVACGKQPTEEINATKASIDAAVSEGAEKYTPADLKAVNDKMTAVMDEVKVQDGKLFKNYDKAKQMLTQVKVEADSLKTKVGTVKEEMKNNAMTALNDANTAVADATAMLDNAPQGKGSQADIAMMKADVQGLQTALGEIQPLIDSGEYAAASERAMAIKDKAAAIAEEVRVAQEKMAQAKGMKKK